MKIKNIIFKNNLEIIEDATWVKDMLIEDEEGNYYPLEFITIECVRKNVHKNSYMLTVPYRLIVNQINFKFIFETIQKLEEEDFFKYHESISNPIKEEKQKWKFIKLK